MNFTMVPHCRRILFRAGSFFSVLTCAIAQLFIAVPTFAQATAVPGGCGSLMTSIGWPTDYRSRGTTKAADEFLKDVEKYHFTWDVESLRRGRNAIAPGVDIAYTLRVYPNHYRALISMAALGEKQHSPQPEGSEYTVECWFMRAITFASDDNIVRMLFAQYLIKQNRNEDADAQLNFVASRAGDNAFTHNNLGLLYFDMKNYDKALLHSHKAIELGLGIPTLPTQLKAIGKWTEPSQTPAGAPTQDSQ